MGKEEEKKFLIYIFFFMERVTRKRQVNM